MPDRQRALGAPNQIRENRPDSSARDGFRAHSLVERLARQSVGGAFQIAEKTLTWQTHARQMSSRPRRLTSRARFPSCNPFLRNATHTDVQETMCCGQTPIRAIVERGVEYLLVCSTNLRR